MMKSSWAGAMGYTQFLPTDFDKYGVDFNGDGKRDIWGTVTDALASAANSLHSQGWDGEQTWAYEVKLPAKFDCTLQGPDKARPISEWIKFGVERVKDRPFPDERLGDQSFIVLPAGLKGPAFLATNNFSVLKLYNNSDVYAIFVGHVADMIGANAPVDFVGAWQPVERFPRDRIQRFQEAWWRKATMSARSTGSPASRHARRSACRSRSSDSHSPAIRVARWSTGC